MYPTSSLRKGNKLNREGFDVEKFKERAIEQQKKLEQMKLKCKKLQAIREGLKPLDLC